MKTRSGLTFLGCKFSMELIRTEGVVSLVKGQVDECFEFLIIAEAVEMQ